MKTWTLLFLSLLSASAQTMTTGTIVGDITDAAGAVVRGANVSLDFPATGDHRTTVTGEDGQYRFPLLKPGVYTVSAQAPGLQSGVSRIDQHAIGVNSARNQIILDARRRYDDDRSLAKGEILGLRIQLRVERRRSVEGFPEQRLEAGILDDIGKTKQLT